MPQPTCWDRRTVSSPRGVAPRLLWAGGMEHKGRSPLPALEASGRRVKVQRSRPRGCREGRCLLVRCCRFLFFFFPLLDFLPPCWDRVGLFLSVISTEQQAGFWVPVGRGAVCWWRSSTPAIFHVSRSFWQCFSLGRCQRILSGRIKVTRTGLIRLCSGRSPGETAPQQNKELWDLWGGTVGFMGQDSGIYGAGQWDLTHPVV